MVMELWHATAPVKGGAVERYVTELVTQLVEGDTKALVFAYHKEMLDAVERGVNKYRHGTGGGAGGGTGEAVSYIRIDGSVGGAERNRRVAAFQEERCCRVAVLQTKAAGVGLTMTAASVVVFAELAWVPGELLQAEDRAHRVGQAASVSVQYLLAKGSVDEVMWGALQDKVCCTGQVLDGRDGDLAADKAPTPPPVRVP